jgi:hypothetical protein
MHKRASRELVELSDAQLHLVAGGTGSHPKNCGCSGDQNSSGFINVLNGNNVGVGIGILGVGVGVT